MKQEKRTVYIVKYTAANGQTGGSRCSDQRIAEGATAALKRTGEKNVRIIPRKV